MAERKMTICDVDERNGAVVAATAHVRVDVNGKVSELDLCKAHLTALNDVVSGLVGSTSRRGRGRAAAAVAGPGRRRGTKKAASAKKAAARPAARRGASKRTSAAQSEAIRAWARSQGMDVKERGRLSNTLLQQYAAATGGR